MTKEIMAECLRDATNLYHGVKGDMEVNALGALPEYQALPIATIAAALYRERMGQARQRQ